MHWGLQWPNLVQPMTSGHSGVGMIFGPEGQRTRSYG